MSQIQFDIHKNFVLNNTLWGETRGDVVVKLLDNVIGNFYTNLDLEKVPKKPVSVNNSRVKSESQNYPEIIKTQQIDLIYLCTQGSYWCQYAYQFAHELCHHVIGSDFHETNDRFGWLEESLCELASIYSLLKMSETWAVNAPYAVWLPYSKSLKSYADNITSSPDIALDQNFNQWLSEKLQHLFTDRYMRKENRIIAVNLLPIFLESPELWKAIHYLKYISVSDDMGLDSFLTDWKKHLPEDMHENFGSIQNAFVLTVTEAE